MHTLLQLVLTTIMVGQAAASDARAAKEFADTDVMMDVWTRHGGGIRSVRDRLDALEQSLGQRPRPDPQTCRSDKNSSLLRR